MAQNKCIETEGVLPISVASSKDSVAKDYRVFGGTTCNVVQVFDGIESTANYENVTTYYDNATNEVVIVNVSRSTLYSNGSSRGALVSEIPVGHKVFVYNDKFDSSLGIAITGNITTSLIRCNSIGTILEGVYRLRITKDYDFVNLHPVGDEYRLKMCIFDLTAMFGSGNEPSTAQEFAERLGYASIEDVPYVPYNEGTVMGAGDGQKVSQLVENGDFSDGTNGWEIGGDYSLVYNYLHIEYTKNAVTNQITSIYSSNKYLINFRARSNSSTIYFLGGNINNSNYVDTWNIYSKVYQPKQDYINSNRTLVYLYNETTDKYIDIEYITLFDLTEMFGAGNEPSTADEFAQRMGYASIEDVPYMEYGEYSRYRIPLVNESHDVTTNIFLTKPLMKIGDVADYVDYKRGVVVRRIGSVDMGTLSWAVQNLHFLASVSNANPQAPTNLSKCFCDRYSTSNGTAWSSVTEGKIGIYGKTLRVMDSSFTDATAFKESLDGIILYYELATPVEEAISLPQLPIYKGNVIDAECTIKPSKVYIKSKK